VGVERGCQASRTSRRNLRTPADLWRRLQSCLRGSQRLSLLMPAAALFILTLCALGGGFTAGGGEELGKDGSPTQRIELLVSRLEQAAVYGWPSAFVVELSDEFRDSGGQSRHREAASIVGSFLTELRTCGTYPRVVFGPPDVVVSGNEATVSVQMAILGCTKSGHVVFDVRPMTLSLAKENLGWKIMEADDLMGVMAATLAAGEPGLASRYRSDWHKMRFSEGIYVE
jgi:hypothetical protein